MCIGICQGKNETDDLDCSLKIQAVLVLMPEGLTNKHKSNNKRLNIVSGMIKI